MLVWPKWQRGCDQQSTSKDLHRVSSPGLKNHEFRGRRPRNDAANGLYVLGMSLPVIRSRQNHREPTSGRPISKNMIFVFWVVFCEGTIRLQPHPPPREFAKIRARPSQTSAPIVAGRASINQTFYVTHPDPGKSPCLRYITRLTGGPPLGQCGAWAGARAWRDTGACGGCRFECWR